MFSRTFGSGALKGDFFWNDVNYLCGEGGPSGIKPCSMMLWSVISFKKKKTLDYL